MSAFMVLALVLLVPLPFAAWLYVWMRWLS